ncbi:SDR family oxidoreductase [Thiomicrospira microaerophila]|uniref:SDR family NAD(P)-dependent oxidoreductase n=1 Tax=Thiomicrospira microaerophila TaxID=406020 RepID=UPI00200BD698|nr:SDR family oxidoreductase [Thiomicrospira microaerophila]UQB42797.1 SDR family oxidoreductase [Thiomicrospira microaerophila]
MTIYPELNGKRVFITGASSGIGAGMAQILAKQGCKLVLHYCRNESGIAQTLDRVKVLGAQAQVVRGDFRDYASLGQVFNQAWSQFSGLDGLVNNAGLITKTTVLDDVEGEAFNQTLAVNLQAPYRLSSLFAQACIAAKQPGVVINNSSIHGQQTCEWFSAYAASKAGLDAMMKVMAVEWGQYGIRVNNLAPGVVPVERTVSILKQPKFKNPWMKAIPLGRYGSVEEMGAATAFLLSDAAAWMTGSVLTLDGGLIARGSYPYRD